MHRGVQLEPAKCPKKGCDASFVRLSPAARIDNASVALASGVIIKGFDDVSGHTCPFCQVIGNCPHCSDVIDPEEDLSHRGEFFCPSCTKTYTLSELTNRAIALPELA
jgi:hypothetical protein